MLAAHSCIGKTRIAFAGDYAGQWEGARLGTAFRQALAGETWRTKSQQISDFLATLRSLAEPCEYGPQLNDMLRDRLVIGINDDAIQLQLLAEADLDLTLAVKLASSMQTAERNTRDITRTTSASQCESAAVNQFKTNQKEFHRTPQTGQFVKQPKLIC